METVIVISAVQGVPIRIEVGPRDVKAEQAVVVRRDNGEKVSNAVLTSKQLNIVGLQRYIFHDTIHYAIRYDTIRYNKTSYQRLRLLSNIKAFESLHGGNFTFICQLR